MRVFTDLIQPSLKPTISVVIPCHNNAHSLDIVLQALAMQTDLPEEIICIDDASDRHNHREIVALTRRFGAGLFHLPESAISMGRRSMARNMGTNIAKGDVLLYLDGDMIVGPQYIEAIRYVHAINLRAMVKGIRYSIPISEQNHNVNHYLDVVSEKRSQHQVQEDEYRVPQNGTISSLPFNDHLSAIIGLSLLFRTIPITRRQFLALSGTLLASTYFGLYKKSRSDYSKRWDFCASNNLSVRRIEVQRIGYWDEYFYGWGEEDMDFAYRLYKNGCIPILPSNGPIYAYHLDHPINKEENLSSLNANAQYFMKKYPIMAVYRGEVYSHYGVEPFHNLSK